MIFWETLNIRKLRDIPHTSCFVGFKHFSKCRISNSTGHIIVSIFPESSSWSRIPLPAGGIFLEKYSILHACISASSLRCLIYFFTMATNEPLLLSSLYSCLVACSNKEPSSSSRVTHSLSMNGLSPCLYLKSHLPPRYHLEIETDRVKPGKRSMRRPRWMYRMEGGLKLSYDKAWINLSAKCIWD